MHRNQSAQTHQFAMIPQPHIPRASFLCQATHKTTFDAGYLVPIFVKEILPGDTISLKHTIFGRLATPLFPIMDNMYLDTFYFFVPNRLVWDHWVNFMGQQDNPTDSISYVIPQQVSPAGGYTEGSLQDYFGLPTVGQLAGTNTKSHSALPLRAYNLIYNTWFKDENLQNASVVDKGDGPDTVSNYVLLRRGKRFDYFTSCLPNPQKGTTQVSVPLGGKAPVSGLGKLTNVYGQSGNTFLASNLTTFNTNYRQFGTSTGDDVFAVQQEGSTGHPNIYADLTQATGVLINQLRQSIMIQELLEVDARGGTRYTEIVRAHFGVISPDARLQRPEYLGGGSVPVSINPIAQTSATGVTGGSSPIATLAAMGTVLDMSKNGFNQSFTEHGHVIGLAAVRADLTYQQGLNRMWTRSTRYDFYFPSFANLGEKAVRNDEIYCDGSANDTLTFGYQEAWAEYRYEPNRISGYFRSTNATPLDGWHLAQKFTSLPTLNSTFIQDTPPVSRIVAVGAAANGQQFIVDAFFNMTIARAMPMYSVPGISSHLHL